VSDIRLSTHGESQVRRISPLLKEARIEHCYCSPLSRCRDTLRLLDLDCPVTFDEGVREIDFGLWEGLSFDQVQRKYPDQADRWATQHDDFTFPGGAHIGTFNLTIQQWFDVLLQTGHNRVLVVAHGGVLRTGLRHLLGVVGDKGFGMNLSEAAITKVSLHKGYPYLEKFNCRG